MILAKKWSITRIRVTQVNLQEMEHSARQCVLCFHADFGCNRDTKMDRLSAIGCNVLFADTDVWILHLNFMKIKNIQSETG